jgi:hypothetical protein
VQLSILTTILDLAGSLAVVAGLAFAAGLFYMPAGVLTAGAGLLFVSWLIGYRAAAAARTAAAERSRAGGAA